MIINHNISAISAHRHQKFNAWRLDKNISKLSSGLRITTAGDDASGLAVSERMRSQVRGLRQAERNVEDGISFIQTTEGYLQESQDVLQRVRELAIQAANGIYSDRDRAQITVEVDQLIAEVDRVASQAEFNRMHMLTGRFSDPRAAANNANQPAPQASIHFHVGANAWQRVQAFVGDMSVNGLGLRPDGQQISIQTIEDANSSLARVDEALDTISKQRADLGAIQNRLEHTSRGLMVAYENQQASESRIRDLDMAEEMVDYVRNQILQQSSTAMLAQANLKTTSVLSLLQ